MFSIFLLIAEVFFNRSLVFIFLMHRDVFLYGIGPSFLTSYVYSAGIRTHNLYNHDSSTDHDSRSVMIYYLLQNSLASVTR